MSTVEVLQAYNYNLHAALTVEAPVSQTCLLLLLQVGSCERLKLHCSDDLYHKRTFQVSFTHNSSLEGAMKLNFCHSAPLEMPFPMQSFFVIVKIFIFRPKTMDYSPWFEFLESEKSSEKRIPSERASQEE